MKPKKKKEIKTIHPADAALCLYGKEAPDETPAVKPRRRRWWQVHKAKDHIPGGPQ